MPERTHPTQEDEALRQARTTAPPSLRDLRTRAGIRWIAAYLTTSHGDEPMTGEAIKRAARLYVLAAHRDDRAADAVMWDLRRALPEVLRTDTRAEYATRLLLHVEGVTA
ncbi:hypothetical protein PUR59_04255 [Streptomyces sp. SP18ES09]|uniref:hypothetical protein n=1 Tax=Streptomyces sp. SP18ES09 TaxID=3002532 RepID=UPI002E771BFD|nr:hypothetical protein [Streptomyces sp. SP18ES09]MEE1814233.1 hypothetical protein [Streptomyces sp. SP18ES09]